MAETSPQKILEYAFSVLSGPFGPELIASFSSQIGFLKIMCKQCLIDCRGCINNCPHPECWPDTTVIMGPTFGRVTLEGFQIGEGKDAGKIAGYVSLRDAWENKIYSEPCIITLPYDN
jgi:hypothetical protein